MKRTIVFLLIALTYFMPSKTLAQTEELPSISLYDVINEQQISLDQFKDDQALVLIFTSNRCPYSKIYVERIKELCKKYANQQVSFALVNSNLEHLSVAESIEDMKKHVDEHQLSLSYFADKEQLAKTAFQIEKNPEAIILLPTQSGFTRIYQGAIDDNPQASNLVNDNYIEMALNNILAGKPSPVSYKRPVGCKIKSN